METITSVSNQKVKELVCLMKDRAFREESGLFVVEGALLASEAAKSKYVVRSVYCTERAHEKYRGAVAAAVLKSESAFIITNRIAEKLSGLSTPQGVFTVLEEGGEYAPDAVAAKRRAIVLDSVRDPANLGAISRSALAFGFDALAVSPDCADWRSDKAQRAAMGALLHCCVSVCETGEIIPLLRERGFAVYAAALGRETRRPDGFPKSGKLALVIGNEASGLGEDVVSLCDAAVGIPTDTRMMSLNAAAAAAVLMYCFSGVGA